jgi:CRP-like cAMP-binding protein
MNTLPQTPETAAQLVSVLQQSALFAVMTPDALWQVAQRVTLLDLSPGEALTRQGDAADAFYVLLTGEAAVQVGGSDGAEPVEVGRMSPPDSVGEIGLLLDQPRTATVAAVERLVAARFDRPTFMLMFEKIPGFGLAVTRGLANRLQQVTKPKTRTEKPPRRCLRWFQRSSWNGSAWSH